MRLGRKTHHEGAPDISFKDVIYIYTLKGSQALKKSGQKSNSVGFFEDQIVLYS